MRGRRPAGPDYVDHLPGSALAKQRLKVVLETMVGEGRVLDACAQLNICEQRFHQIRQEALEAALAAMEPGVPGRPAQAASPVAERIRDLEEQLAAAKIELQAAKVREEIAVTMPRVVRDPAPAAEPEKKTRRRHRQLPPRRPPGKRKNT